MKDKVVLETYLSTILFDNTLKENTCDHRIATRDLEKKTILKKFQKEFGIKCYENNNSTCCCVMDKNYWTDKIIVRIFISFVSFC